MAFPTKCEKNGWNSCGLIHKYHKCIPSFHQKPAQLSKHPGIFQTEVIFPHFNFKPVLQMQSSRILYVNSDHEQYLQTLFPLIIQKQLSKKLMEIYHDNWHSWFQSWLHWYVWLIKMVSECCSGCACYNSQKTGKTKRKRWDRFWNKAFRSSMHFCRKKKQTNLVDRHHKHSGQFESLQIMCILPL